MCQGQSTPERRFRGRGFGVSCQNGATAVPASWKGILKQGFPAFRRRATIKETEQSIPRTRYLFRPEKEGTTVPVFSRSGPATRGAVLPFPPLPAARRPLSGIRPRRPAAKRRSVPEIRTVVPEKRKALARRSARQGQRGKETDTPDLTRSRRKDRPVLRKKGRTGDRPGKRCRSDRIAE